MYVRKNRSGIGALSPTDVANQIMPKSQISSTPGFTEAVWQDIEDSAASGQIAGFEQKCPAATGPGAAQLVNTGAGIALSIVGGLKMIPTPVTVIGGAIIGIFASIFAHHAQAVAKEQQVECAAVPAFNDTLSAIADAVSAGTITPQQGIASLSQALTDFQNAISQIMRNDSSNCNAGCVWWKCAQAAVAEMQSQFQDLISQSPASGQTATSSGSASTGSSSPNISSAPSWLPFVAIGVAIWLVLR